MERAGINDDGRSEIRSEVLHRLTAVFFWACVVGFPLILGAIIANAVAPFIVDSITAQAILHRLTFLNLALTLAVFQLFLGVVLSLIGVTLSCEFDAQAGPARLRLISASPGILLIVLANAVNSGLDSSLDSQ